MDLNYLPLAPVGLYHHSDVPVWTWVAGDMAGQPVWNGTCELCCPCCGLGDNAFTCGDVPGRGGPAGNSTTTPFANWASAPSAPNNRSGAVNQPVPEYMCVDIEAGDGANRGKWRTTRCDMQLGLRRNTLHHVIVMFSGILDSRLI